MCVSTRLKTTPINFLILQLVSVLSVFLITVKRRQYASFILCALASMVKKRDLLHIKLKNLQGLLYRNPTISQNRALYVFFFSVDNGTCTWVVWYMSCYILTFPYIVYCRKKNNITPLLISLQQWPFWHIYSFAW